MASLFCFVLIQIEFLKFTKLFFLKFILLCQHMPLSEILYQLNTE